MHRKALVLFGLAVVTNLIIIYRADYNNKNTDSFLTINLKP